MLGLYGITDLIFVKWLKLGNDMPLFIYLFLFFTTFQLIPGIQILYNLYGE